jgi:hypothetical protein
MVYKGGAGEADGRSVLPIAHVQQVHPLKFYTYKLSSCQCFAMFIDLGYLSGK